MNAQQMQQLRRQQLAEPLLEQEVAVDVNKNTQLSTTKVDEASQQIMNNVYDNNTITNNNVILEKEVPTISVATAAEINAIKMEKEKYEKLNDTLVQRETELDTKLNKMAKFCPSNEKSRLD